MILNEQERQVGRDNFKDAVLRYSRRKFLAGAGVAVWQAASAKLPSSRQLSNTFSLFMVFLFSPGWNSAR